MTVTELTDLKTTINWLLENGEFKDTETSYNIAMNAVDMLEKQLSIPLVSQRSELFAEQDSKDFILWQRDREIRRLENGKYKWREFEYNREFFLEKYLEDRNKANCG